MPQAISIALAAFLCLAASSAAAEEVTDEAVLDTWPNPEESHIAPKYKATLEEPPVVEWSLGAELGFLVVASHIIQLSNDGDRFDYRQAGGQDAEQARERQAQELGQKFHEIW